MQRLTHDTGTREDRHQQDGGTVVLLVAVLLGAGVLLGMAALTVDVGQLYAERRQLQNGADAGALAVAGSCAVASSACDTSTAGLARAMADGNANDAASAVRWVCGSGRPGLPACPTGSTGSGAPIAQCPAAPTGAKGWVQVATGTATAGGQTLLPPVFARALAGNDGYAGTQVLACAVAGWGPPARLDKVVPITLSQCEWDVATAGGTAIAPAPAPGSYPGGEVALRLHSTSETGTCPSSGGAHADLPGGFGWLAATPDCQVTISADSTVAADPGVAASGCGDAVTRRVGTVLHLPVYSQAWGSGASGTYRIAGFAAFFLSGYNLPGAHPVRVASPSGGDLCQGSDKCLYGWFTAGLVPGSAPLGHGPAMGSTVVTLTG